MDPVSGNIGSKIGPNFGVSKTCPDSINLGGTLNDFLDEQGALLAKYNSKVASLQQQKDLLTSKFGKSTQELGAKSAAANIPILGSIISKFVKQTNTCEIISQRISNLKTTQADITATIPQIDTEIDSVYANIARINSNIPISSGNMIKAAEYMSQCGKYLEDLRAELDALQADTSNEGLLKKAKKEQLLFEGNVDFETSGKDKFDLYSTLNERLKKLKIFNKDIIIILESLQDNLVLLNETSNAVLAEAEITLNVISSTEKASLYSKKLQELSTPITKEAEKLIKLVRKKGALSPQEKQKALDEIKKYSTPLKCELPEVQFYIKVLSELALKISEGIKVLQNNFDTADSNIVRSAGFIDYNRQKIEYYEKELEKINNELKQPHYTDQLHLVFGEEDINMIYSDGKSDVNFTMPCWSNKAKYEIKCSNKKSKETIDLSAILKEQDPKGTFRIYKGKALNTYDYFNYLNIKIAKLERETWKMGASPKIFFKHSKDRCEKLIEINQNYYEIVKNLYQSLTTMYNNIQKVVIDGERELQIEVMAGNISQLGVDLAKSVAMMTDVTGKALKNLADDMKNKGGK